MRHGRSAGRPGDAHVSGKGQPHRSARRHAAWRDGDRPACEQEATQGISIPASALTSGNGQPAVWIVDPASLTVSLRNVEVQRFDPATVVVSHGLAERRRGRDRGRSGAASGPEGPPARGAFVTGLNLSEWALKHRSFIIFIMIAVTLGGPRVLFPSRPRRGSALHLPHDDRAGRVARRDHGRYAEAGDRTPRAQAAGNARPRFSAQLHEARPHDDLRQRSKARRKPRMCRTSGIRCARMSATSAARCRPAWSDPASTMISATPMA